MAPYRFPLEKVLSHKESLKELQLGKVKEIDLLIQRAEESKLAMEAEVKRLSQSLIQQNGKEISAGELMGYYRRMEMVRGEIERLKQELHSLAQRREKEMEILLELHREIKMLEKLKEKGIAEYRAHELKKEIERIDEANVVRYARRAE